MAKARKKTRKAAAKRPAKKLKGRKVAKAKGKSKPKRAKARKQGGLAGAVQAVTETLGLHKRLAGPNTFED